ncbi:MAG: hypothetical protein KDD61_05510 [Bdellovibrionales bacterium]|nr:hypothetical protein [Bdellovibrionales bacterium]
MKYAVRGVILTIIVLLCLLGIQLKAFQKLTYKHTPTPSDPPSESVSSKAPLYKAEHLRTGNKSIFSKMTFNLSTAPPRSIDPKTADLLDIVTCLNEGAERCGTNIDTSEWSRVVLERTKILVAQMRKSQQDQSSKWNVLTLALLDGTDDQLVEAGLLLSQFAPQNEEILSATQNALEYSPSLAVFELGWKTLQSRFGDPFQQQIDHFAQKVILSGSPEASLWLSKRVGKLITKDNIDGYSALLEDLTSENRTQEKSYLYVKLALTQWKQNQIK